MEKNLSEAQERILLVLGDGEKYTYEELAEATGLSYDGVRGRVSELKQRGINIQRLKEGKNTVLMMEHKKITTRKLKKPVTYGDLVSKRMQSLEDFYGITEFLNELRDIKKPKKKVTKRISEGTAAVLALSDLHFGEIIKDQSGKVVFDTSKAYERIENLTQEVLQTLTDNEITEIYLMMLGDMVDGDSIYKNHLFYVEKAAVEQVKDVVSALTGMIKTFTEYGIYVNVHAVRGNHGITNYKNLEMDNWDNVVYDMIDLTFSEDELVNVNHYQTDEAKVPVMDRHIVLYHGDNLGDQIKTASGLKSFRGICGKHKLYDGDIIMVGHLHQFGVEYDQGKMLIRNGSITDTSEYAFKLNMYSEPCQVLLIINVDEQYPIIIPAEV